MKKTERWKGLIEMFEALERAGIHSPEDLQRRIEQIKVEAKTPPPPPKGTPRIGRPGHW